MALQSTFNSSNQINRPGLLLANGHVYAAFGSDGCNNSNQGWILSYNAANLQLEGAFDSEPGGFYASFWQKGAGSRRTLREISTAKRGKARSTPESNWEAV